MSCDDALINGNSYCKAKKNNKIFMIFTSDPSGFFFKLVDKIPPKAFRFQAKAFRFTAKSLWGDFVSSSVSQPDFVEPVLIPTHTSVQYVSLDVSSFLHFIRHLHHSQMYSSNKRSLISEANSIFCVHRAELV